MVFVLFFLLAVILLMNLWLCLHVSELRSQLERIEGELFRTEQMVCDLCEERMESSIDHRKDLVDEGFENIMRYAVSGKTGFEG